MTFVRPCLERIHEKVQMNLDLKLKSNLKPVKFWLLTLNNTHQNREG